MKKFVIEREFPGAGKLSPDELRAISQTSCTVLDGLGKPYTWVESFVTDNKIFCVHLAESEEVIREHSRIAKFPVSKISEVVTGINPDTRNK